MKNIKITILTLTALSIFSAVFFFSSGLEAQKRLPSKIEKLKSKKINAEKLVGDVKFLSADNLKGRETGTPESLAARNYVLKRFRESGVKPFGKNFEQEFSFEDRQKKKISGANVVGFIKGKKNPEKYIVVTAHFDHVGERNGEIYNGADDNASGTAALFAIAKYFIKNKPAHSIIFAAFDAEEKGLQGARFFVENLPVKQENILLNINLDMVSRNEKSELYAAGTFHYPQFKPYLETVQKSAPVKLKLGHDDPKMGRDDWTFQSDHGAFHRKKIPFIYFGVEDHKDYHKPTDDFENIDPKFFVNAVETIVSAIKEIDKSI